MDIPKNRGFSPQIIILIGFSIINQWKLIYSPEKWWLEDVFPIEKVPF